jgi:uncharacterized protein
MAGALAPMRIAITGASGMIGQALAPVLAASGHTVVPVSRRAMAGGIVWDPDSGTLDPRDLEGVDAVVHLAGENLAGARWTAERKRLLRESRITPTRLLADRLSRMSRPPRVLISASAVGIYGDRGDELLDEQARPATDFLGTLATDWEAAADPARAAGIRVVHPRFGVVLTPLGGALAKLLPPFRLGLGGQVGSGRQWLPWIALDDALGVINHLLAVASLAGAVNAVAPEQVTNAQFGASLGRALHRPAVIPLPAFALKLAFGEMGDATLLASQRVVPQVLAESGYRWLYPSLDGALEHLIGKGVAGGTAA